MNKPPLGQLGEERMDGREETVESPRNIDKEGTSAALADQRVRFVVQAEDDLQLIVGPETAARVATITTGSDDAALVVAALERSERLSHGSQLSDPNFFAVSNLQDVTAELVVIDVVGSSSKHQSEQIETIQRLLEVLERAVQDQSIETSTLRWQFTGDGMIVAFINSRPGTARQFARFVQDALVVANFKVRILVHGGKCLDVETTHGPDHITGSAVTAACLMLDALDSPGLFVSGNYYAVFEGGFDDAEFVDAERLSVVTKHGDEAVVLSLRSREGDDEGGCD